VTPADLRKLTDRDVTMIRRAAGRGVPLSVLAERYAVSMATICHAATGASYRHVPEPAVPLRHRKALP